jgi:hypothetical protein
MVAAGAGSVGYFFGTDEDRPDAEDVPSVTLDSLVRATGLTPTHVKIDVEGFEGEAIAGGREALSAHRPAVFLELHGAYLRRRGKDPAAVLGQLIDLGYRRFLSGERPMAPAEAAGHELIRLVCLP